MQITIYSPDRHFVYDGSTLEKEGLGGGVTARIRMGAALAARNHVVSNICNCPRRIKFEGVEYIPLDEASRIDGDVLVMNSSGDAFDLSPLQKLELNAKVRVVLASGDAIPKGTAELEPAALLVCSNFIRTRLQRFPFVKRDRILVANCGVNRWNYPGLFGRGRDTRRLIYSSHPSKGLDPSLKLLRILRQHDPRFSLACYGGNGLWGEPDEPPAPEDGFSYSRPIRQRALAAEYQRSGFLLQLQTREEPFGITVVEAMAAGCIVLASSVGAFPETIRHGENGFLFEGKPGDPATVSNAAELILRLSRDRDLMRRVRKRAMATPFTWLTMAEVWEAYFQWLLDPVRVAAVEAPWSRCLECGEVTWIFADGYHCKECGYFSRTARPAS